MRVLMSFFAFLALQAQATLDVVPTQPRVDGVTTFTLVGVVPTSVTWTWGDGSAPEQGGANGFHAFRTPGTYVVRAAYTYGAAAPLSGTATRSVVVVEPRRIQVRPVAPEPGQVVSFMPVAFLSSSDIRWNFGDGTQPMTGLNKVPVNHVFPRQGVYTVTATDSADGYLRQIQTRVVVGATGPAAPFSVSYLALRWEDGTFHRSVVRGSAGLAAYADLKTEGAGILQVQWLVDGQVFRTVSRPVAFAQRLTLDSSDMGFGQSPLSLPTNLPGEHQVTLRVLQPTLTFEVPVIRYYVRLEEGAGPVLEAVSPGRVHAGREVDLELRGKGLTADTRVLLGKDVAQVGPLRILSPERAMVKVFVAPTARGGSRSAKAQVDRGVPAGTARLDIVPLRKGGQPWGRESPWL